VYLLKSTLGEASVVVEKHNLVMATVERGDFSVSVRATGALKPLDIQWVSSQVAGKVEKVYV